MTRSAAFAIRSRLLLAFLTLGVALTLASCSSPTPPQPPTTDEPIDVEGLWLVEPGTGSFYGAGGTTTLEFGAERSGTATFLSRADANDVLTCERHVYAAVAEHVLLLDGTHYDAQATGTNVIELSADNEIITLTRVTGSAPVEPCLETEATELQSFNFGVGSFTTLAAVGSKLYFNSDETGNPIVDYDTATNVLGAKRIYTGSHDHIVAARTDDEFYGNCACGNSTTLERFDLNTMTALMNVSTQTDFGIFMQARQGVFDGTSVLLTGRDFDNPGVNHVLTLHPDTLALQSQQDVLTDAFINDLAWTGSQLAALVNRSIVLVGADGRADETIGLPATVPGFPRGLAVIGTSFYVLTETADDEAVVFEVTMP